MQNGVLHTGVFVNTSLRKMPPSELVNEIKLPSVSDFRAISLCIQFMSLTSKETFEVEGLVATDQIFY
jgi:hypothetical protein